MLILYVLIFIAALWGLRIRRMPSAAEALSIDQSTMIKGVFVLLVFASHVGQYLDLPDSVGILTRGYQILRGKIGQLVVIPFLFYSGYGLRCSIEKKGKLYLRSLPTKRVLRIYLHAVLIAALFLLVQLFLGKRYSVSQLAAGFLFWGSFGNSNWYIFAILLLYLFTWFSFSVFKTRRAALLSCFLFTAAYCVILSRIVQHWWYDTVFVFWLGLIYPEIGEKLRRLLNRRPIAWLGAVLLSALIVLLLTQHSFHLPVLIRGNLRAVFAMLSINLFLERFQIGNRLLHWLGSHVFECYLLQRLPMLLLSHFSVHQIDVTLFVLSSAVGTVLLVLPTSYLLRKLDRHIFKR